MDVFIENIYTNIIWIEFKKSIGSTTNLLMSQLYLEILQALATKQSYLKHYRNLLFDRI